LSNNLGQIRWRPPQFRSRVGEHLACLGNMSLPARSPFNHVVVLSVLGFAFILLLGT
jgi:hypothetical protein